MRAIIVTSFGKYIMIGVLFCLALLCYFVGSVIGAISFIAMGFMLELAFWVGIFKKPNKASNHSK